MRSKPRIKDFLKKKEIEEGKETKLEKNDFLALVIAAASVFVPVILGCAIALAAFVWIYVKFGLGAAMLAFVIAVIVVAMIINYIKKDDME